LLLKTLGVKERAFLEGCLRVEGSERKSASELMGKSLFSTDQATVHANALRLADESMTGRLVELEGMIRRCIDQSQRLTSEELSELHFCLSAQLERVGEMTLEEARH
jgi:hypothetical protein